MTVGKRYKERYETRDTPWDIGKRDFNLIQTVTTTPIEPCEALDMGLWLSLLGNADELRHAPGPSQRTATDIVNSVEPYFEILSLVSSYFGSNRPNPPKAWVCLMRKRPFE